MTILPLTLQIAGIREAILAVIWNPHMGWTRPLFVFGVLLSVAAPANSITKAEKHGKWSAQSASLQRFETEEDISARLVAGDRPTLGDLKSSVTLVVFEDFACPVCLHLHQLLKEQFIAVQQSPVKLVFRSYPLPQHRWSRKTAELAVCAYEQGSTAFAAMSDLLYQKQQELLINGPDNAVLASKNVNFTRLRSCLDRKTAHQLVDADIELAQSLGVHSTPVVFINGKVLFGPITSERLWQAVKAAKQSLSSNETEVQ